ncbi:hypothetical protein [Paracidovorax cattleyae]|uniref:hypothetical protein n=1 Tax=Paracidovorax cattleyae TaxID=80868 RepID=UPI00115FD6EC|nr:hypothetical protein [Paracidovorax cattleyae]MBF9263872.1 hypothetical protein [Paracidovorax cattleyae]
MQNITRGRFFTVLALALLGASCSRADEAPRADCTKANISDIEKKIFSKLSEKHPGRTFKIEKLNFNQADNLPFWHAQIVTTEPHAKQHLFAMYYCDGSVELTALMRPE